MIIMIILIKMNRILVKRKIKYMTYLFNIIYILVLKFFILNEFVLSFSFDNIKNKKIKR